MTTRRVFRNWLQHRTAMLSGGWSPTVNCPTSPSLRPMNPRTFADPRFCRDAQQSKAIIEEMIRDVLKRVERREIPEPEAVLTKLYEWRDRCAAASISEEPGS